MSSSDTIDISTSSAAAHTRYDEYEDSGVDWIGNIPAHWGSARVQHVADIHPSSVDKNSEEDEIPVQLCNYTDVYYGRRITDASDFMEATATDSEIATHELQSGDVLVTKDSEARDDIAVPALVDRDMPGVLCGYHLAQLRPSDRIEGAYLYYCFKAPSVSAQFEAAATGITRYGLSVDALKKSHLYLPPLDEQRAIAAFLDRETERIDALIEKKEQLIDLLEEKRTTLISRVVTKGLDADVEMQDSGGEWLEEIPAHWQTLQLRRTVSAFIDYRGATPEKVDGGVPLITAANIEEGRIDFSDVEEYITEEDYKNWMVRGFPERGDVMITTEAPLGKVARIRNPEVALAQRIILFKTRKEYLNDRYLAYYLRGSSVQADLKSRATGSTAQGIKASRLKEIEVTLPPLDEQYEIGEYLDEKIEYIDSLESRIEDGIEKLKEYRTALISSAVTGQIDVRENVEV